MPNPEAQLSGLELRRALAEALGYTKITEGCVYGTLDGVPSMSIRAYESDATLSEALLDKVCREKGWLWEVGSGVGDIHHYCQLKTANESFCIALFGATASEARARAILQALRSEASKRLSGYCWSFRG